MLDFIARNEKWLFVLGAGCGIFLHIFNIEKIYALFHIANTGIAVFFLLIIWAIASQNRGVRLVRTAPILLLTSVLIILGFVPLFQNWDILIKDVSTIIFIMSATPPIVTSLGFVIFERAIQKA